MFVLFLTLIHNFCAWTKTSKTLIVAMTRCTCTHSIQMVYTFTYSVTIMMCIVSIGDFREFRKRPRWVMVRSKRIPFVSRCQENLTFMRPQRIHLPRWKRLRRSPELLSVLAVRVHAVALTLEASLHPCLAAEIRHWLHCGLSVLVVTLRALTNIVSEFVYSLI